MLNQKGLWNFARKASRPPLTEKQVRFFKKNLPQLLKAGIEVEYNLPEQKGTCQGANYLCECTAVFPAPNPMPGTKNCFQQCKRWDPSNAEHGNCEIAKQEGCAGPYCVAFVSPCPNCNKYDRGCNTCPRHYDAQKDPTVIRETLKQVLQPSEFVGKCGPTVACSGRPWMTSRVGSWAGMTWTG
jgi:hypothetical protein